jgi:hypothetical protein
MQELQTLNIHMRIITEDNIDNLTSMNSNHTIQTIKSNILNNEQMKELYKDEYDLMMEDLDEEDKLASMQKEEKDEKEEMQKRLKEKILQEKKDEDEDEDDEEGLSQVTKDSIKRAEEEYERNKDLVDSSSDEDEPKPPLKIDEPLTDKLTNAFNSFVETLTPSSKEESKEESTSQNKQLLVSQKLPTPQKSILTTENEHEDDGDEDDDINSSLKIKTPKDQTGGNKKSINFTLN